MVRSGQPQARGNETKKGATLGDAQNEGVREKEGGERGFSEEINKAGGGHAVYSGSELEEAPVTTNSAGLR